MKYNFQEAEAKRQQFREENQTNAFDITNTNPEQLFSIDTPPPTVSGKLHIGHVFSYTQAEIIARYKRMKGFNVFYPMGYDDNGIPTEQLVERELKINLKDVERKEFVQKCLEINQKYRDIYKRLRQSLGFSVDRNRTYATISPQVQQLVQKRFVEMYKKGDIVGKQFPALRCTKLQATIAQAETEEKEFEEFFNYLNFTLEDGEKLVIATTRPEMIPACVAVFAHPDDERFAKYIGKQITTPLGNAVPFLGDDKVKIDKGSGVVMCCTYGDETDVYRVQKHKLPEKIIINRYGKIKNSDCEIIEGLKVEEARERIMEYFAQLDAKRRDGSLNRPNNTTHSDTHNTPDKCSRDNGLPRPNPEGVIIIKRDPIIQAKKISERGKMPIEIIPVYQRFVNLLNKKNTLLQLNEKMTRYPEFMKKRSNDRINNLARDRNISRARKFGIPIPIRYEKGTNKVLLPSDDQLSKSFIDPLIDLPEGYTAQQVEPETLIFDTRFTSSQTPFINQMILEQGGRTGKSIIPMSLRPQAHDIIRTRLLYTTLQTYLRTEEIPFKDVMMSGHVLAGKSEKISKSACNAKSDPEQLIKQRGADAVRYRTAGGQLGKDMVFDEEELKKGQKLVTKLRNAFQFVKMLTPFRKGGSDSAFIAEERGDFVNEETTQEIPPTPLYERGRGNLYPTDQRILEKLNITVEKMNKHLDNYEYGLAKIAFEEFFRADFCDNYLELIKVRLYQPERFENGEQKKQSGQHTLYFTFLTILKLIAPYLPHITEEIYQDYFTPLRKGGSPEGTGGFTGGLSIHQTKYPQKIILGNSPEKFSGILPVLEVVELVRKYKSESQISMGAELSKLIISANPEQKEAIQQFEDDLQGVTKAKKIERKEGELGVECIQ